MNELALFAGAGGGILGGKLLGWRTVCAVEWDAYAASPINYCPMCWRSLADAECSSNTREGVGLLK